MLVDDDLPHAKVVLADRGYDSDHIRNVITSRGGTPVIMGKANRKVPILVDTITYALRNRVERCFKINAFCASVNLLAFIVFHSSPAQGQITGKL
jgi:IS5 family transposase